MATITTTQHGNSYCPQAQFVVTESSSTGGATTYAWTLKWVTYGYTVSSSASKAYTAKIDGTTVASGSFAIGGKSTTTIASGTYTISKGTSSRSVPIYLSFAMTFTWSGTSGSTKTASGTVTLAAKTSYTISYNANGGSGAPSSQTKWYDTSLTLSSTKPTRTGYTFKTWNTNSSGTGTSYSPGATYTGNAALTLYAIWTANTYTVSYNANGGSGAPSSQTKTYGVNLTLSSTKPTRTNYNFLGWSTSASGSVVYAAGATYTNNSAVTLYAVWQLAYVKPRITSFSARRCESDGTVSETGTYLKVAFSWATDYTVSAVVIQYKVQTGSSWTNTTVTASGTSGSVSQIIGSGGISIETSYHVRAYVSDSGGTTYSTTASIGTTKFPIDVKSGGTGVAIGKVSEKDAFEVGMASYFNDETTMNKSSGDTFYHAYRTDTGTGVSFGVGSGGVNHGIYSRLLDKWMMYGDASNVYLNGNATTATSATKDGSGNTITSTYDRLDGSACYAYLTCGDSNNTTGYRIALQQTMYAWVNARIVLSVSSRHQGCGILCIGLSIHGTIDSYEMEARYFGSTTQFWRDNWLPYYNTSTGVFTLIWKYQDYSPCKVTVIEREYFNAPSNGTWSTSLGSYGTLSRVKHSHPKVVYSNSSGTSGTVTLSATADYYNHIKITYKNDDGQFGTTTLSGISGATGTTYGTIVRKNAANSTIMLNAALFTISGTTITISRNSQANIYLSSTSPVTDANALYITKVELWE